MMPPLQVACVKFKLQRSGSRLQQEVAPGKIHLKFTLHSSPKVVMDQVMGRRVLVTTNSKGGFVTTHPIQQLL